MLFAAALLSLRPLTAATVTWDTSTTAGFQSGNGTWGTDNFWSTDGTTLLPWVSGDTASFVGQAAAVTNTITVGSNQTIGGLNFGSAATSGNWTLSGSGALALSGNASFSVAAGSTAEIRSSLVLSSNTLTKTGAGTLVLNNPALTSANISVDEGILRLKVPSTTTFYSGGNITVGNGAELAFAANDTFGVVGAGTAAAVVLNGGTLSSNGFFTTLNNLTLNGGTIKANGGVVQAFGAFQFFGTVSVTKDASIVQSGSNGNINLQNTIFNVSAGATLDSNATFLNNPANVSTGTLTKSGAGSLVLNGASAYSAGTTITAGTLTVGNSSALGSGGVTVSGGTLNLASFSLANTITLSGGTLSGTQLDGSRLALQGGEVTGNIVSGAVTKTGTGTVTLRGANTYTGATTVSAGTLILASGATMGSGALVVSAGANLVLNANASTTALTGSGTVTIGSGAALTLSPPSGAPQFFGGFSGSGSLIKSGAGEALLAGDSSGFTGAVTLNGGILSAQNSISTLGSGDVTVTGNTTIATFLVGPTFVTPGRLNNRITVTSGTLSLGVGSQDQGQTIFGNDIIASGAGSIRVGVGGNGTYVIEKDISNTGTGTVTLASGSTLQLGNGGVTGTFNGGLAFNLSSAGRLAFKRSDNITYSGVLSGTGSLAQAGTGNLTLTGTNTYSGGTTVSAGRLTLASGGTLGAGAVTISGTGVVDLGGQTVANSWVVNGGTLQGGALDIAKVTASAGTISANLGGAGGFSKSGTGSLVLSGNNTYAGGTTLNGGTLTLGSGSALGTGAVTLTSGTLNLNGQTIGNNLTLGAAVIDGSGTLSGVISGNVAFAKTGTTTLTFIGLNTYSGGTTVSAGTLIAGSNTALGSGAVAVSGGTLDLGTSALSNTITLSLGSLAGSQLNGDKLVLQGGEVTGVVSSGALSKTSSGTVTLSGSNTYAGGTTVSAGTLVVNNANALGSGAVTLSGGSLDVKGQTVAKNITLTADSGVAGTNGTISGVISGAGLLTKSGTGTLTLSGNNTFEGGALINAGTLVVNGEVLGNMVVSAAAKLAGSGIVHDVTVVAGGSINAGGVATVGTLRADTLSLQGGGKIELNFTNAALGAGNGFDHLLVSGAFDLSAASLTSKCQLILAGLPTVFDPTLAYSFDFLKYGSLNLGGNNSISDLFTIDVNGLKDQLGGALDATKFSLVDDAANQRILLNYGTVDVSPIPEPSTYGLSLGCLGLAIAALRRRRRRQTD